MAYSPATTTRVSGVAPNADMYEISISGTSIGPADELEISNLPNVGRIVMVKSLTSTAGGGAATSRPAIGTATNPLGGTQGVFQASAATAIGTLIMGTPDNGAVPYYSSTGKLFYRTQTNTGTCTESAVIYVLAGWE